MAGKKAAIRKTKKPNLDRLVGLMRELKLPETGWSISGDGYAIYSSRQKYKSTIKRGARRCRMVILALLHEADPTAELNPTFQVHHMDFNKTNDAPSNLLYCEAAFNNCGNSGMNAERRDPYTGEPLTKDQYQRRYGS
jgi:hypothetical protein